MALTRRTLLVRSVALAAATTTPAGIRTAAPGRRQTGAGVPPAQLRALRAAVRGRVLTPGDHGYAVARRVYNRRYDGIRPPAVVQVRDPADVAAVVRWAGRFDRPLVTRSGGHAYDGSSTSRTSVVVDLGGLDAVRLADGVATIGPGARAIDIVATLARRGAAVPLGSCPTVALGGLVLGGGMGLAGRAWGLTLDNVGGFDVVDAAGRRRRVDARRDPDLFWALRGGGAAGVAIVTAVHLRAHRARRAAWFSISFPRGARAEALAAWDALAPSAPGRLTAILSLQGAGASAFGQFLGSERALRRLVAPLARLPGARVRSGSAAWLALQRRWAGCADGGLATCRRDTSAVFVASSLYLDRRLGAAARQAFLTAADTGAVLLLDAYGGAINRVPAGATAFVHRGARAVVQILSYAPLATARGRVRGARALIARFGDGEAYQNYPDPDLANPLAAYYGANLPRLRAIKAAVDPDARFHGLLGR